MCKFEKGICVICKMAENDLGACGNSNISAKKLYVIGTPYRSTDYLRNTYGDDSVMVLWQSVNVLKALQNKTKSYIGKVGDMTYDAEYKPKLIVVDDILEEE